MKSSTVSKINQNHFQHEPRGTSLDGPPQKTPHLVATNLTAAEYERLQKTDLKALKSSAPVAPSMENGVELAER